MNYCAFNHSARNLPFNDSMKALSVGFPGRSQSSVTPRCHDLLQLVVLFFELTQLLHRRRSAASAHSSPRSAQRQLAAVLGREAVTSGCLDQPTGCALAGLGEAARLTFAPLECSDGTRPR
jgi:hypothetical protein